MRLPIAKFVFKKTYRLKLYITDSIRFSWVNEQENFEMVGNISIFSDYERNIK